MTADRKIRRLICDPTNHFSLKIKIMVLIFIIGTIASFLKLTSIDFMGFYIEIKEKYNLLSSDSVNCCSLDNLKVTELIKSIKFEVINQNEALDLIEEKLNKKTKVSSLAIIGSSGIGKTKFLLSLVKNFYWRENIQQHTLQNIDGVGNDVNLEKILNNLTKCGMTNLRRRSLK
ncbi:uncharacterized protein LOC129619174 isoform X2 [Condylostylus longicornis]|uniref:uncharacterized protein LOC129619174 isoform X2 n=1 Tax=Condylostylus longicornis TaxID=2530218 RepID=UPI00244DDD2F|nr:uncharacterized protein LOC129619174 isoform X2 [Condylostylus longicornis]